MDRERTDQILEKAGLGVAGVLLVYAPLAFGAVRGTEFVVVIGLTLLLAGIWLARLWVAPQTQILWPPLCWAVLAFTGYALVRAHFAVVQWDARKETLQIVVYAVLFLSVLNTVYRQESVKWLSFIAILVGLGVSLYAVTQYLTQSRMVWHLYKPAEYVWRGSGTFVYHNHLAGFLAMLLPLAISFSLAGRMSHALRIITGYAAIAMLAGLAVTLSRGGWLANLAALAILLGVLVRQKQHRIAAVAVLALLIAGGWFFYGKAEAKINERVKAALDKGPDQDPRWRLWQAGVQNWQDSPWWGHGPGHFDHVYPKYRQPVNQAQIKPNFALSDFINTLVDYGAAGVALIAAAFGLALGGGIRVWRTLNQNASREEHRGSKRAFVLGATLGLTGILLAAVTDFQFHLPANAILAVTLMALLASHLRFISNRYWVPAGTVTKLALTLLLLAAGVFAGVRGSQWARHEYWVRQSLAAKTGTEQAAALEKALAIDPLGHEAAYRLGEYYRRKSWEGEDGYQKQAAEAMKWFKQAMDLNPYDSYALVRYAMCLDWVGRNAESEPYFLRALAQDPNNYYTTAYMGWHYFQMRRYAQAERWLDRSKRLNWWSNPTASRYLDEARKRVAEEKLMR